MNLYEKSIQKELNSWTKQMTKAPSYTNKISKSVQTKVQSVIPVKVQNMITSSIKTMTESIMFGSAVVTINEDTDNLLLSESDWLVQKAFQTYQKTAVVQGAGFGAGGIVLGLADFPALLTIKVKFLFDCAKLYGYDINDKSERLFMLYVFQLAFSSDEHRLKIYNIVEQWDSSNMNEKQIDWEKFQTEYRDYIDLAKMLQLLPMVGAIAGGVANYRLLEKLKKTAMNCYRIRYFQKYKKV